LSRNLSDLEIPSTLFCNGRSAEVWPEAVAAFAKAGHDVAGHGYLQDQTLFSMNFRPRARNHQEDAGPDPKGCGQAPNRLADADLRPFGEHAGISRRGQDHLVLGRARRQRAVLEGDQGRQDADDPVERLRRQPHAARKPARLFRRLQGHVRLSLRLRARRADQHRRPQSLRRPPRDDRGVSGRSWNTSAATRMFGSPSITRWRSGSRTKASRPRATHRASANKPFKKLRGPANETASNFGMGERPCFDWPWWRPRFWPRPSARRRNRHGRTSR